jgi:hypothetical protein
MVTVRDLARPASARDSPRRPRRRSIVVALALVFAAFCTLAWGAASMRSDGKFGPLGSGKVFWAGDAETGDLSQWASSVAVAGDRIRTVTWPVRQGRFAYRFEVRGGDNPVPEFSSNDRAELGQANPGRGPLIHAGAEEWYGFSVRFDRSFPDASWQVVAQWKQLGGNPPPAELSADDDVLAFSMGGSSAHPGDRKRLFEAPLTRRVWHDFVMHVKWSPSPREGFVELWHDGELVVPKTSIANMYRDSSGDIIPNHARIGYYRDRSISAPGVVYIDAYKVGNSYAAVAP